MNHEMLGAGQPVRKGIRDRVLTLRSYTMFEGLDDDALLLLAEHGEPAIYSDGDIVSPEGETMRSLCLIVEGELRVSRQGQLLTVRKAGEAYGGLPVLARVPSTLAVAVGKTFLLEIPAPAFESALTQNFSLLRTTLRQLGTSVLKMRGNLPTLPSGQGAIDEGTYYDKPRSLVERLINLRQGNFRHMNMEALIDLSRSMVEVRVPAGALLWSAGDPSTHALHVDVGRVRCTERDGRSASVGHGFTIGVMDVWSGTRVYEARAETPLIAYRIDVEGFLALLEAHPEVGLDLLRGFARDLLQGPRSSEPPPIMPRS
ncbi:MAG TPA: cyclic nucleotide-binding domain-containing protein [Polyangiaceae bacterium]|nr:cyclic nucleotide-binding domain-containing protein [Polyangiaceae bacterium]